MIPLFDFLVRSTMKDVAIVWDPYTTVDTNKLERIQRRAVRVYNPEELASDSY
jgi:hypothetical protein